MSKKIVAGDLVIYSYPALNDPLNGSTGIVEELVPQDDGWPMMVKVLWEDGEVSLVPEKNLLIMESRDLRAA